jgi:hypothetical protein
MSDALCIGIAGWREAKKPCFSESIVLADMGKVSAIL